MSSLVLLPAVDVAAGQAVQLVQGRAGSERVFGEPREAARRWAEAGATWIHLVDLDAAFGRGSNAEVIGEVIADVTSLVGLNVELSGGIRDEASLERALATGCARVNIGTAALEQPDWCAEIIAEHGERIAIGLDVRTSSGGHRLAARGWTQEGGDLFEILERLEAAGCARYVVTDVNSDGMLTGPNVDLLSEIAKHTEAPLVASGGISTLDDIARLSSLAGPRSEGGVVEGAIIGTALYVGNFTLADALAAARGVPRAEPVEAPRTESAVR